jgi:hypothetical protein
MGIYSNCRRVSATQLAEMLQCQHASELATLLHFDLYLIDHDDYFWVEKWGFDVSAALKFGLPEGQPPVLDIETDGTPIGDLWVGYGPVRYLTPAEVRKIVSRLAATGAKGPVVTPQRLSDYECYEPVYEEHEPADEAFPFSYEEAFPPPPEADVIWALPACEGLLRVLHAAARADDAILFWTS